MRDRVPPEWIICQQDYRDWLVREAICLENARRSLDFIRGVRMR